MSNFIVNIFHRARVLRLGAVGFADDIRLELQLFERNGERPELGAVYLVRKGEMLYFALAAVHYLGEMDVKVLYPFVAQLGYHIFEAGSVVFHRFKAALLTRVEMPEVNARRNGIQNARFLCGPVESVLASDAFRAEAAASRFTKAIVDPAYKGLASGVAQALAAIGLERIVYVACGPKNFVRDAKCFAALGYRLVRVEAVDLFPGALHIEAVGLFVKEAGESNT